VPLTPEERPFLQLMALEGGLAADGGDLTSCSRSCLIATARTRPFQETTNVIPKELLSRTSTSLITIAGNDEGPNALVGAPHHAPAGVRRLKCDRPADQNTGLLARQVALLGGVTAVVVTNAKTDPNKSLDSDYALAIRKHAPGVLLEIHGHGGTANNYDIEISSGSLARGRHAKRFAELLAVPLAADAELRDLTLSGDFGRIYFQATQTATMQTPEWIGLHIELPLAVRKHGNDLQLPERGERLAAILASALHSFCAEAV